MFGINERLTQNALVLYLFLFNFVFNAFILALFVNFVAAPIQLYEFIFFDEQLLTNCAVIFFFFLIFRSLT